MSYSDEQSKKSIILQCYNDEIAKLSSPYHNTSAGVLYCCVLAVATADRQLSSSSTAQDSNLQSDSSFSAYLPSGVEVLQVSKEGVPQSPLLLQGLQAFFSQNNLSVGSQEDIITYEMGDVNSFQLVRAAVHDRKRSCSAIEHLTAAAAAATKDTTPAAIVNDLISFTKRAIIRSQIIALLSDESPFPIKPMMTSTERGIKETELLSFTSLSSTDLFRNDQMQRLKAVLQQHMQVLPNFTGALRSNGDSEDGSSLLRRRFFRQLSPSAFAQVLSREREREPKVLRDYYELTDDLLYVLHWPPPDRRIRKDTWSRTLADPDPSSPADADDHQQQEGPNGEEDAIAAVAVAGVTEDKDKDKGYISCEIATTTLTPAANAIVLIHKSSSSSSTPWLSIYLNDCVFGLRIERSKQQQLNPSSCGDSDIDPPPVIQNTDTAVEASVVPDQQQLPDDNHVDDDDTSEPPESSAVGAFFLHTEDDVRFIACAGPIPDSLNKPDGHGTCCLMASFANGMMVSISSLGITKIHISSSASPTIPTQYYVGSPGVEVERYVGAAGITLRTFSQYGPSFHGVRFHKEIMQSDGTRWLIPWPMRFDSDEKGVVTTDSSNSSSSIALEANSFYKELCSCGPPDWTCVKLGHDGSVLFFTSGPSETTVFNDEDGTPHASLHRQMKQTLVDAESKSLVSSFADGRLTISAVDGGLENIFPDGTIITKHSAGTMLLVSKLNLPSIEIDMEIDSVSRQHSRGIEVPINKGGDRVRCRVNLPDGSAVLVKYNTLLTATTNGSIKMVRRDKTSILIQDSGMVRLTPRCSWDSKQEAIFVAECEDFEKKRSTARTTNNKDIVKAKKDMTTTTSSAVGNNSFSQNKRGSLDSLTYSSTSLSNKLSDGFMQQLSKTKPAAQSAVPGASSRSAHLVDKAAVDPSPPPHMMEDNEKDAIFTFDFNEYKCNVLDHQYNSFDIDLSSSPSSSSGSSALDPKVVLSGEVAGLKPPAVADRPMEPRLFVVNRAAEATELLSGGAINSMETLLQTCPDAFKTSTPMAPQPSDLGPSQLHKYFVPRRLLGDVHDSFTFAEVFGSRSWHPNLDNAPAAALLYIRTCANNSVTNSSVPSPPRYFEVFTATEKTPLSSEGHGHLQKAIESCDHFRAARLKSIDRFKVEEDRSREELEEEEQLAKRLRAAFKNAKAVVAKRKEHKALAQQIEGTGMATGGLTAQALTKASSAIIENLNEDAEDDDESNSYFDDDVPVEPLSIEEVEIKETFHDFASSMQSSNNNYNNNHHHHQQQEEQFYIQKDDLQDAYIRLLNRHVSWDLIAEELDKNEEDFDPGFKEFTLSEFRNIYYSLKYFFDNRPATGMATESHNNRLPSGAEEESFDADDGSMAVSQQSSPLYWRSDVGKKAIKTLPVVGLPLDFRQLNWNEEQEEGEEQEQQQQQQEQQEEEQEQEDGFLPDEDDHAVSNGRFASTAHPAVGSALSAARRNASKRAATAPE